ncbi:MAG: ankyrin repeat domain-containing protein, partial [Acidobacteriota bacterium]
MDRGANIEADGAVIGGGTPMSDAAAFAQWRSARLLLERGARTKLWESAALGLMDRVKSEFSERDPSAEEITGAFWCACHGGQREAAEYLLNRGANLNWVGWDRLTPIQAARRSGALELAAWLESSQAASLKSGD